MSAPRDVGAAEPKTPMDYGIKSSTWFSGREPSSSEEWAQEMRLLLRYTEQEMQKIKTEEQAQREWATGRRPENDREWRLEYTFRQLDNERQNNRAELQQRYQLLQSTMIQAARGTLVRSLVLVAIVIAIIIMPIVGIIVGIQAQTFSQFIAPVTGIGGTVLGYWFGQRDLGDIQNTLSLPKQETARSGVTFPEESSRP